MKGSSKIRDEALSYSYEKAEKYWKSSRKKVDFEGLALTRKLLAATALVWVGSACYFTREAFSFSLEFLSFYLSILLAFSLFVFVGPFHVILKYQMLPHFRRSWGVYYLRIRKAVLATTSPRYYRVTKIALYDPEGSSLDRDILEGLEDLKGELEYRRRDLYQIDATLIEDLEEVEGEGSRWLLFQKNGKEPPVLEGDLLASLANPGDLECYALNLRHCHFEGSRVFVPQETCLIEKNFAESTIFSCWWGAMVPFSGYGRPWDCSGGLWGSGLR